MSEPRKPWETPIHYSHEAETKDNPPYPDKGEPVTQNVDARDEKVFGIDEDDEIDGDEVDQLPTIDLDDDSVSYDEDLDS